jgi:hypothetical protein
MFFTLLVLLATTFGAINADYVLFSTLSSSSCSARPYFSSVLYNTGGCASMGNGTYYKFVCSNTSYGAVNLYSTTDCSGSTIASMATGEFLGCISSSSSNATPAVLVSCQSGTYVPHGYTVSSGYAPSPNMNGGMSQACPLAVTTAPTSITTFPIGVCSTWSDSGYSSMMSCFNSTHVAISYYGNAECSGTVYSATYNPLGCSVESGSVTVKTCTNTAYSCDGGSYNSDGGSNESSCSPCLAGYYCPSPTFTSTQYPCPASTYSTGGASYTSPYTCNMCASGKTSPQASTSSSACTTATAVSATINTVQFSSKISGISATLVANPTALATQLTLQLNTAVGGGSTKFAVISIKNEAGMTIFPVVRQLFGLNELERVLQSSAATTSITVVVAVSSIYITSAFVTGDAQALMTSVIAIVANGATVGAPTILCDARTSTSSSACSTAVSATINTVQFSSKISGISATLVANPTALATQLTLQLNTFVGEAGTTFTVISIKDAAGMTIFPVARQLFEATRVLETTTSITVVVAVSSIYITSAFVTGMAQALMTSVIAIVANGATVGAPTILCDDTSATSSCAPKSTPQTDHSGHGGGVAATSVASTSIGAAIGGAVGGVVFVIIIIVVVIFIYRHKKRTAELSKRSNIAPAAGIAVIVPVVGTNYTTQPVMNLVVRSSV